MSVYSLDLKPRLHHLTWHLPLVSRALTIFTSLTFLTALGAWGLTLSTGQSLPLAIATILTGLTSLLALALTYGRTSLPAADPPRQAVALNHGDNLADAFSYETLIALHSLPDPSQPVTLGQLFTALYQNSTVIQDLCLRLGLPPEQTAATLNGTAAQPTSLLPLARKALKITRRRQGQSIRPGDFLQIVLTQDAMQTFLRQHDLKNSDIAIAMHRYHWLKDQQHDRQSWWRPEHLLAFSGVGLSFAAGYTSFVDRFARLPSGNIWDVVDGHESELEQVMTSLARERQSNVLLVGSRGVGTMGIIKELYHRISRSQAHPALNGQRVLYLHLAQLATIGSNASEQQALIARALNEMEQAGNIIVVLDGVSSILGGSGTLNAGDTLSPFLSSPAVRVIALVSPDVYHQTIQPQPDLLEFFEVIDVPPLERDATLRLLVRTIGAWEQRYGVFVPYLTLRELVTKTEHILPFVPFPEKAFDILEDAVASEQGSGEGVITPQDIHRLISQKVNINVGDISATESDRLLNLEDVMHEMVINQRTAITAVSRAMIRARAGTRDPNKPVGTFLFLGPTGVGKTQTAKALAHGYYGHQDRLQRLDMTQFQGQLGVERLLGSGGSPGQLTSMISDNPFSVLLLDEFEKADRLVQQIFMPVFDEGYITDNNGRKYSFANTILIATSNAGAEYIRQQIGDGGTPPPDFADGLREHVLSQNIFTPELLNRFDGVITFTPLSREHVEAIAALMLRRLNQRLDTNHGITVAITPELTSFLADIGFDPEFGARPMSRAIQDTIEYAMAEQITRGLTQPGQTVTLQPDYLRNLQTAAPTA